MVPLHVMSSLVPGTSLLVFPCLDYRLEQRVVKATATFFR